MDDRWVQFALFLGISTALLVLAIVGIEIARRAVALWRQRRAARERVTVEHERR